MTATERKKWAEEVILCAPPAGLYRGLTIAEAALRAEAVTVAAAQKHCWTHLANHLALIHVEIYRRSKLP